MNIDVSIIIINFNTFKLTTECINSVIRYTNCSYEILLVDNGSTEKDPKEFLLLFPNIKLISSSMNVGFSKGNNLAITQAKGIYILLLNSDTLLLNNAIDLAVGKLKISPGVGALTVKLLNSDFTLQPSSIEFTSIKKRLFSLFRLEKIFKANNRILQAVLNDQEHYTDWISGAFFLVPREVINKFTSKKLPEDFFMYCEDVQWCYRIQNMGYKIMYYPKGKILHYGGKSSNKQNSFSSEIAKNDFLLYKYEKGIIYSILFCFVTALLCFSKRGELNKNMGKAYLYLIFNHKNLNL